MPGNSGYPANNCSCIQKNATSCHCLRSTTPPEPTLRSRIWRKTAGRLFSVRSMSISVTVYPKCSNRCGNRPGAYPSFTVRSSARRHSSGYVAAWRLSPCPASATRSSPIAIAEAVEIALHVAVAYHQRRGEADRSVILGDEPSYHGITAGALGCSGHPRRRRAVNAMLSDGCVLASVSSATQRIRPGLEEWKAQVHAIGPERIAALIVEPVGGAACGAVPLPARTLRGLRDLCDEHGILLIADEVMTGLGRTGRWFGCEHASVAPDPDDPGQGTELRLHPDGGRADTRAAAPGLRRSAQLRLLRSHHGRESTQRRDHPRGARLHRAS